MGPNRPRHLGFVGHIKLAYSRLNKPRGRHSGNKSDTPCVTVTDNIAIIKAWDHYAALPENMVELKSCSDYQYAVGKHKDRTPTREEIFEQKKEILLQSRAADHSHHSGEEVEEDEDNLLEKWRMKTNSMASHLHPHPRDPTNNMSFPLPLRKRVSKRSSYHL
jgi:hypothetical protein